MNIDDLLGDDYENHSIKMKDDEEKIEDKYLKLKEENEKINKALNSYKQLSIELEEKYRDLLEKKDLNNDEYKDRYIRLLSDFDNYKKRIQNEREKTQKQAISNFVEDLIPVLDNFQLAVNTLDKEDSNTKGISMIYKQLESLLEENGIEIIKQINIEFDPFYHHAAIMEENKNSKSGFVFEIIQCGYILNGKVLKPALVKVAK